MEHPHDEDREAYATAMRLAMLSSLQARSSTANLGFRCASSVSEERESSLPQKTWPADSLYRVDARLVTAADTPTSFASGGRIKVVSMFYANCPMACPLTIDTLRNLDAALTPSERQRVDVLLLTLDPERDTAVALRALTKERRISDKRWTLARASTSDTRLLAAALGIQYRALADGAFQHSSVLVLLDAQGRVLARSGKLGIPSPEFVGAVRAAANQHGGVTSIYPLRESR